MVALWLALFDHFTSIDIYLTVVQAIVHYQNIIPSSCLAGKLVCVKFFYHLGVLKLKSTKSSIKRPSLFAQAMPVISDTGWRNKKSWKSNKHRMIINWKEYAKSIRLHGSRVKCFRITLFYLTLTHLNWYYENQYVNTCCSVEGINFRLLSV